MSQSVVAKRYASGLFELSQQNGQTGAIQADMQELKKAFRDNKGLGELFGSPKLSLAKKKELIASYFSRRESARFEYILCIAGCEAHG